MGYDSKKIQVSAIVSRHNSQRDIEHDELWDELIERILAIVDEERYSPILAMVV